MEKARLETGAVAAAQARIQAQNELYNEECQSQAQARLLKCSLGHAHRWPQHMHKRLRSLQSKIENHFFFM